MCNTYYLSYLNNEAIQYNLATYATQIIFIAFGGYNNTCTSLLLPIKERSKLIQLKILMCLI